MRGKGSGTLPHYDHQGITPACAGKSGCSWAMYWRRWDHPRVCGEKLSTTSTDIHPAGSPPRVRGKGAFMPSCTPTRGITPACAGKSKHKWTVSNFRWDHPRVCGEKDLELYRIMTTKGSPPRVRGKAIHHQHRHSPGRITPACAGKSWSRRAESRKKRDHPRVCGEKFHPASDRKLGRVRGTKRSSGPAPAAAPAGLAGSCPASPPWSYPPRITVSRPRP